MPADLLIGTSGWYYEHWNEVFYPKGTKADNRLKLFSEHFDTVEVNNTFYHLPSDNSVQKWFNTVPDHFVFSIKASRYITHIKRLKDTEESLKRFYTRIDRLKKKLGPILFQLPPFLKKDTERLELFISHLKKGYSYVFEFRDSSWFDEEIYDLLGKSSIALCLSDLKGHTTPEEITADFTYIRLHGPSSSAYHGSYGKKELQLWKNKIEQWQKRKISVYCYFDNDEKCFAVKNADELKKMLNK